GEYGPGFGSERARSVDETAVNELDAAERIDQDRRKSRRKDHVGLCSTSGAEPEHRKWRPGDRWNVAKQLEERIDEPQHGPEVGHGQAERHADRDRRTETV